VISSKLIPRRQQLTFLHPLNGLYGRQTGSDPKAFQCIENLSMSDMAITRQPATAAVLGRAEESARIWWYAVHVLWYSKAL
jgi:hypothetical protein